MACLLFLNCNNKILEKENVCDLPALENGDLIYRLGDGYFSGFFRDFSEREKLYSHVGIIVKSIEGDTAFVIHAEGSELTGAGAVKKEPVAGFLKGVRSCAIYRATASTAERNRVSEIALRYHYKRVQFDPVFDCSDSTSVYCTELAAVCINKALGKKIIDAGTIRNGKKFISIDDTYLNKYMQLIFKRI